MFLDKPTKDIIKSILIQKNPDKKDFKFMWSACMILQNDNLDCLYIGFYFNHYEIKTERKFWALQYIPVKDIIREIKIKKILK